MERFVAKSVVLGTVDYGEADRVVTLFTEERGRLSAFALNAKNSRKRFGGALEPFTLLNAQLVERRGDTFRMDRADIVEPFLNLRSHLAGIARAAYACELVRETCREKEAHPELFGELVDLLFRLSRNGGSPEDLLAFELTTLHWAGLRPTLNACISCGAAPSSHDAFDADLGGLLCGTCARQARRSRPVSPEASTALRQMQAGDRMPLPPHVRREARAHLDAFVAHHLGHKLRSVEFMRSIGIE
jgi:DNA repair protein RecO (recombination protein O)